MFYLNQTLNKIKLAEILADAKMVRQIRTLKAAEQVAFRSTPPHQASTEPAQNISALHEGQRPHLTDTEALTRKVRGEMVRDAQAAFAAVMVELKASQVEIARDKQEETEDAILSQHYIQIDHVGED